ncbi:MAG: CHRD domain-containing protein [candidate division Zixibacteria bacterium]|nr:CHRD domain-containing protein [candidate division Zixibacteria bacterium]
MKKTARIQSTLTFSLTVLIVLLAVGPLNATVHNIGVGSFFFSPTKTVVSPGDTVRWSLVSGIHTSSSTAGSPKFWDSGILAGGVPFDVVFIALDGPGPFPYVCNVHPFTMIDTIFMAPPPPEPDPILLPFILDDEFAADCAGTGTGASGFGLAILSPDSSNLSFFVTHDVDSLTGAHIHKAEQCVTGSIVFPFSSPTSPISEGWALSSADVNALFAGSLYVNIHSTSFPAGELRGQIIPEPIRFVHTLDEAQAAAGTGTGSFANGCAIVTLSSDGLELSVEVSHDVETTNNGHIHKGAPGVAGAFVFPFTNFNSPITEVWALDTSDIKDLFLGDLYVNIHSDSFPAGEIRGQIVRQEFSLIANIAKSSVYGGDNSSATGFGLFTLSEDQRHLSVYVEHDVTNPNGAHIHIGLPEIIGPIVFPLSGFTSPISDTWDNLSFTAVSNLLDSLFYINIHSDEFPDGEIRGQIEKKQVQYSFELSDTLANECLGTGTGASGSATTTLKPGSKELTVEVTHDVTMPIGAHIHRGFQCVSGPIIFPLSGFASPIEDIWYLSTADVIDLLQGELYVNIHSDPFPAGEIRGQLGSCCQGIRGDVNGDGTDGSILDLVFLVDLIFRGGDPASCSEEADVNGDGTSASILDLVFLVDLIFRGGVAPGPC